MFFSSSQYDTSKFTNLGIESRSRAISEPSSSMDYSAGSDLPSLHVSQEESLGVVNGQKKQPSVSRITGTGRCKYLLSENLPQKCPCEQGIFMYEFQKQNLNDRCVFCHHSLAHHEDIKILNNVSNLYDEFHVSDRKSASLYPKFHLITITIVWTPRTTVVRRILERALDYSLLLIRGTPSCGKTILMNLFARFVVKTCPDLKVHCLRRWPSGLPYGEGMKHLEKQIGLSAVQLLKARHTLICIDNAESTYEDVLLWSFFQFQNRRRSASFILFTSYGRTGYIPPKIRRPRIYPWQMIYLQWSNHTDPLTPVGLLLERDEAEDLVTRYCAESQPRMDISPGVRNIIISISGGHAGALAALVEAVVTKCASITFDDSKCEHANCVILVRLI